MGKKKALKNSSSKPIVVNPVSIHMYSGLRYPCACQGAVWTNVHAAPTVITSALYTGDLSA